LGDGVTESVQGEAAGFGAGLRPHTESAACGGDSRVDLFWRRPGDLSDALQGSWVVHGHASALTEDKLAIDEKPLVQARQHALHRRLLLSGCPMIDAS